MNTTVAPLTPAEIAKAALRRLALARLEPTPENYARAWAEEGGHGTAPATLPDKARPLVERLAARACDDPSLREEVAAALMRGQWDALQRAMERVSELSAARAEAWAQTVERLARGLERNSRVWTAGRKHESLHHVLEASRRDMHRLQQRMSQLLSSWERDGTVDEKVDTGFQLDDETTPRRTSPGPLGELPRPGASALSDCWPALAAELEHTVRAALPPDEPRARELADELGALADRIGVEGATHAVVAAVAAACERARRLFAHRHHLVDSLGELCRELTAGLTELAEDDSWARGQAEAMRARLADGVSARGVRSAGELLAHTRARQAEMRAERDRARDALKGLIASLMQQLGTIGEHTGRFSQRLDDYADVISGAESIDQLAGVVREMIEESRTVGAQVHEAQQRLTTEHARATELQGRVRELEDELRRLSDEVSTDALTQVANRRGLMQAFEVERARLSRGGTSLAIGLIDIDNFKRLNDTLGHAAGDEALKTLAQRMRESLRPLDILARYGGEEFVVLMPDAPAAQAQEALTRLQRSLSASLFMHGGREVFVTFSAGVTAYRLDEPIETALERADEALYEAKHTGKNRTCTA
jgi:diguanylate cyclase